MYLAPSRDRSNVPFVTPWSVRMGNCQSRSVEFVEMAFTVLVSSSGSRVATELLVHFVGRIFNMHKSDAGFKGVFGYKAFVKDLIFIFTGKKDFIFDFAHTVLSISSSNWKEYTFGQTIVIILSLLIQMNATLRCVAPISSQFKRAEILHELR
jgi:hypothetical protein